jgi:nitrogen fixation/metabolism regulation signal transduction histidine kinase
MSLFDDKENLSQMFADYRSSLTSQTSKLVDDKERIQKRMDEVNGRIEKLLNAVEEGTISSDRIRDRMKHNEDELAKLQDDFNNLLGQQQEEASDYEDSLKLFRADNDKAIGGGVSGEVRRNIYRSIFKTITLDKGVLILTLKIGAIIRANLSTVMSLERGEYLILKNRKLQLNR